MARPGEAVKKSAAGAASPEGSSSCAQVGCQRSPLVGPKIVKIKKKYLIEMAQSPILDSNTYMAPISNVKILKENITFDVNSKHLSFITFT